MKNKIFVGALLVLLLSISGLADARDFQTRKPFDAAEFNRFTVDYPTLSQWLVEKSMYQGIEGNPWIMSGMRYNDAFIKQLRDKGWDAERFFYLLDHINMGLLTSQAELKRDAAKVVLDQRRKEMQDRMAAGRDKFKEQMQQQVRSSAETAQKQWAAQRERVANNPYIAPQQKQNILAQMDRSQQLSEMTYAAPSQKEWQAQMDKQRQAWMAEQKRQIMSNPNIPPQQKQAILVQMQRSMAPAVAVPQQQANLSPSAMRVKRQAQQEKRIQAQMQEVRDNPSIHPMQKQNILANLQRSLDQMNRSAHRTRGAGSIMPSQENDLIKNNRLKLMKLFFPDAT